MSKPKYKAYVSLYKRDFTYECVDFRRVDSELTVLELPDGREVFVPPTNLVMEELKDDKQES